ncbi:MAG TPA: DUF3349 domain-containing protein [Propionibacteriaceae bacterium]
MTATDQNTVAVRVLNWLEAGYPDGVPRQDRFPLIALLQRRLTEEQTLTCITELTAPRARALRGEEPITGDDPITADEIHALVERQVRETPSPDDVRRVSARLAAAGWPLADDFEG